MDPDHVASFDEVMHDRQLEQLVSHLDVLERRALEIEIRLANALRRVERLIEQSARSKD